MFLQTCSFCHNFWHSHNIQTKQSRIMEVIRFHYTGQDRYEIPRNITHLIIDSSVREIPDETFQVGEFAFDQCVSLKFVTCPSTLREIHISAFSHCRSLSQVFLNEGLRVIGNYAFGDCTSLKTLRIPSTVIQLGEYVFSECTSLMSVEGLQRIGVGAFWGSVELRNVAFPSTV